MTQRLPPPAETHSAAATLAMPVLMPILRALAREMGVNPDAAVSEGWLAAHDRARRGLNPLEHIGWIVAATRRALRGEWVGQAVDVSAVDVVAQEANALGCSSGTADPLSVLIHEAACTYREAPCGEAQARALVMARRSQSSRSPRTQRYWRARAWAVLMANAPGAT